MRRGVYLGVLMGAATALGSASLAQAQQRDDRLPPPSPGIGALFSGLRGTLSAASSGADRPAPAAARPADAADRPTARSRALPRHVVMPVPRPPASAEAAPAMPTSMAALTTASVPTAGRARQEELMAYASAGPAQAPQPSLFGWLIRNAASSPEAAASSSEPVVASASPPTREAAAPVVAAPEPEARPLQAVGRRTQASREFDALIAQKAQKHGVPVALAHAVVRIESNYNPRAVGGSALGLMQIKHATARGIGFTGSAQDLLDPATNLEWGMRYLAGAHRLARGNVCGTIMRYQSGHRAERMNSANAAYCARVRRLMAQSGEPQRLAGARLQP